MKKGVYPMKSKYGIGLFIFSFVMIYLISYGYIHSRRDEQEYISTEESVLSDGHAVKMRVIICMK